MKKRILATVITLSSISSANSSEVADGIYNEYYHRSGEVSGSLFNDETAKDLKKRIKKKPLSVFCVKGEPSKVYRQAYPQPEITNCKGSGAVWVGPYRNMEEAKTDFYELMPSFSFASYILECKKEKCSVVFEPN
jgi:hypothetical protein